MARAIFIPFSTFFLILSFSLSATQDSFPQATALTPEKIIDAHLRSIGNPEALNSIKNRGINGTVTVQFIQGGAPGKMIGQSMLISAGQNFGLIMRYGAVEYPGEHFAYDGSEVTIANISPGQRSPLGDFLYRYNGLIKEGLLSGVLSTGWALLDIEKNKPGLAFNQAKVDGQELYAIDYSPKTDLNDIKVKLFFDPDTFHHVRTEYRLVVHGEQSLLSSTPYSHGAPKSKNAWNMSSRYATAAEAGGYIQGVNILDEINDSIYVLIEKFDKFKEIEFKSAKSDQAMRLTLPQKYTIEYSTQGQGSTFLGIWDINAVQWIQNGTIDASFFEAQR